MSKCSILTDLKTFFCFLDTMENWDEKKLEEVVNKKHGEAEKKKAKTQIVRMPCYWIVKKITWGS